MAYTNSSLVSYTLLSPNNSGTRTHSIDRITPHCVVGQCSVESLGSLFANPARQASSNYGIGCDGRVGMYVEEKNRSWCSSSNANDQRAITIECASDNFAPYAFKDVVYNKLVDLCVDICKRNGKNKIIWNPDKNASLAYEPKSNEMIFTLHRWLASTNCPGDWLVDRMQDLANKVNAKLAGSTPTPSPSDITPIPLPTISCEKTIWNFLYSKLNNSYAVAGMMGNMYGESGLKADNLENAAEKKAGVTDAQYTAAVDSGKYTRFDQDGSGYGLIQWRTQYRKARLLDCSVSEGKSIGDVNMQLDFVWEELNHEYTHVLSRIKSAKSVYDATSYILVNYVQCKDQSEDAKRKRTGYALTYYDRYANSQPTPEPTPQPTPTPVPSTDSEQMIWDYLYLHIGNAYGVAGLMGNLWAESGLRSNNLQNTFEKSLGMTDDQYTAAVDNGTYTNFVNDKAGYGLAQWTFWSRKQGLYNSLKGKKLSIANLNGQLDYLWFELTNNYAGVLNILKTASTVREASDIVLTQFERPADQSEAMKQKRAGYGESFYQKYAGSTPTPTPSPTPTPTPSGQYIYQGLDYSPVFNPVYYSNRYSDLKNAYGDNASGLFTHFTVFGMNECRQAHPQFNVIVYRNRYPDLVQAFGNNFPLYYKHYIEYGISEGRSGI